MVSDLFKKLKYTGKAEHLSMWLCFFSNKDLAQAPPEMVKKQAPKLVKLMRTIRRRTKMWPTPMVLVEEARKKGWW